MAKYFLRGPRPAPERGYNEYPVSSREAPDIAANTAFAIATIRGTDYCVETNGSMAKLKQMLKGRSYTKMVFADHCPHDIEMLLPW